MAEFYNCFDYHKVMPLLGADEKKCPSCPPLTVASDMK
jgi:hypothetical protein